ncbi:MAG: DMT family transporter [Betaproteobacteria bacterium]|nr:DMT family transporter [Betaproteobacteria bacterium]
MVSSGKLVPILCLAVGAFVWGLIWYPYRALAAAGIDGLWSTTLSYALAFVLGVPLLRRRLCAARPGWMLGAIALAAGVCNLGYVLGMLHGEVMRVLLLFYLAPLWTVLMARVLLGERLTQLGAAIVGLSLAGAIVMLWEPASGVPLPAGAAEWLGIIAGFSFALTNVLIRRSPDLPIEIKSMAVFAGVTVVGAVALALDPRSPGGPQVPVSDGSAWLLLLVVGVTLLAVNLAVQHGLTEMPANQAIVIFLFELVVAAASSWLLAGESMTAREWIGGGMIILASLFSDRVVGDDASKRETHA